MFTTCFLIFKSYSPSTGHRKIVPSAIITNGIIVTFMFLWFCFYSLVKFRYLFLFSFSFHFTLWSAEMAKSTIWNVLFFYWLSQGPRLRDLIVSQNSREILCISFSRTNSGLCIYHLFVWSNFNFLHNSLWIIFTTLSCLVLYSFIIMNDPFVSITT